MIYSYSSISSLRQFGVTSSKVSDDQAKRLIIQCSSIINRSLPSLKFVAYNDKYYASGGNKLYRIQGVPPLLKINSITFTYSDESRTVISSSSYTYQGGNIVRFVDPTPEGFRNIEIDGVFGYVENQKEVDVTINTAIQSGVTSVSIDDVSDLEERDVLVFRNRCIIINSVNYTNNTISIDDPGSIKPIPIGSSTVCYGAVPILIETAVNLLIKHNKTLSNQVNGRIRREKTDNYEYELFANTTSYTGVPEVDSIISSFSDSTFTIDYL